MRRCVVGLVVAAVIASIVAPGCSIDDEECDDDERADGCRGMFRCENAANAFFCERANQVCVQKPGMASCVTIPEVGAGRCPTKIEALAVAGCAMGQGTTGGNAPKCRGDSEDGITVVCHR